MSGMVKFYAAILLGQGVLLGIQLRNAFVLDANAYVIAAALAVHAAWVVLAWRWLTEAVKRGRAA